MKILNLYAGIGGNRKLWGEVEVTSIENKKDIARIYQELFPKDKVIVTDAHKYLLKHYKEFDFIWSSPPCPTHSKARYWASKGGKYPVKYPDMRLYQEILFLQHFCDTKWVVENVDGFYNPLIAARKIGGHYFWSNFKILKSEFSRPEIRKVKGSDKNYGFDLSDKKLNTRKDQIMRNIINPKLGLHIFNCAFKIKQMRL